MHVNSSSNVLSTAMGIFYWSLRILDIQYYNFYQLVNRRDGIIIHTSYPPPPPPPPPPISARISAFHKGSPFSHWEGAEPLVPPPTPLATPLLNLDLHCKIRESEINHNSLKYCYHTTHPRQVTYLGSGHYLWGGGGSLW
jgi:hypothetical protein